MSTVLGLRSTADPGVVVSATDPDPRGGRESTGADVPAVRAVPAMHVHISPSALDPEAAWRWATDPSCGAVVSFLGIPRADLAVVPERGTVVAIDYEAYGRGAFDECFRLGHEAGLRWDIRRVWLAHRTGRVLLEEPSLVVVVAAPHRREAIEAMEWLVSEIKARVPVWKQEQVVKDMV